MEFNKYPDLKHDYRSLKVGDFTWIAKHKYNPDQELVLPYVVERKRMDDLAASIKDGRFHEQKFRLRRCGLKNVIYLVEKYDKNKGLGLPLPSLLQALTNTRVQDGFKVRSTNSLNQSVRFLAMMTKRLTIRYGVRIYVCLHYRAIFIVSGLTYITRVTCTPYSYCVQCFFLAGGSCRACAFVQLSAGAPDASVRLLCT